MSELSPNATPKSRELLFASLKILRRLAARIDDSIFAISAVAADPDQTGSYAASQQIALRDFGLFMSEFDEAFAELQSSL